MVQNCDCVGLELFVWSCNGGEMVKEEGEFTVEVVLFDLGWNNSVGIEICNDAKLM